MRVVMYAVLVAIRIKTIRQHFTYLVNESLGCTCDGSCVVPCYNIFCTVWNGTKDCLAVCTVRDNFFAVCCSFRHRNVQIILSPDFEGEFTFCKLSCTSVGIEGLECTKIN